MGKKGEWLVELANKDNWAQNLDEIPSVIVYSYHLLQEFAKDGEVYGSLLVTKDVYESLMKIPVIMGLIIMEDDDKIKDSSAYSEILNVALSTPMSIGHWYTLALKIIQHNDELELDNSLIRILEKTRNLFDKPIGDFSDIKNWRNNIIGHGALRMENDPAFEEEFKSVFKNLQEYFGGKKKNTIKGLYTHLFFSSEAQPSGKKYVGETHRDFFIGDTLYLHVNDKVIDVKRFFSCKDNRVYLFDSYLSRKRLTYFNSYFEGKKISNPDPFFDNLYNQFVATKIGNREINQDVVTSEEQELLMYLKEPYDYEEPVFLVEEIKKEMLRLKKGVICIEMERGTGKTAFVNRLNALCYENPMKITEDGVTRCYHISDASLRSEIDFVIAMNFDFPDNYDKSKQIKRTGEEIPLLSSKTKTPAKDLAEYLNFYHKKVYQKKYTILVIDGIDEITKHTERILDYIPKRDFLVDGVFVILTCRFPDENTVSKESVSYIKKATETYSQTTIKLAKNDEKNIELMKSFAMKNLRRNKKDYTEDQVIQLIQKADYRFLYLKAYLVDADAPFSVTSEKDYIESYLKYLEKSYNPVSQKIMIQLVVYIALFSNFTIRNYQKYWDLEKLTFGFMGIVNDLMPLLTVFRKNEGDVYVFADEAYSDYVISTYPDEVKDVIDTFWICLENNFIPKYYYSRTGYVSDSNDVTLFFLECFINIWHVVKKYSDIAFKLYQNDCVFQIGSRFSHENEVIFVGKWKKLYGKLYSCLKDYLTYAIEHSEDEPIRKWCEELNRLSTISEVGVETARKFSDGLFALRGVGLEAFWEIGIRLSEMKDSTIRRWFWSFNAVDMDDTVVKRIIEAGLCREYLDYVLLNDSKEVALNWLWFLAQGPLEKKDREFVLNQLVAWNLRIEQGRIFSISAHEVYVECINRVKWGLDCIAKEGFLLDDSLKENFKGIDISTSLKDGTLWDKYLIKMTEELRESISIEPYRSSNPEFISYLRKNMKLLTEEDRNKIYVALYQRLSAEIKEGRWKQFEFYIDFLDAKPTTILMAAMGKGADYLHKTIEWTEYVKSILKKRPIVETDEHLGNHLSDSSMKLLGILSDLMVSSINWLLNHGQKKNAIKILEDYIFHYDTKTLFAVRYESVFFPLELPFMIFEEDSSYVYCTENAIFLLNYYYQTEQIENYKELMSKMEESVTQIDKYIEFKYERDCKYLERLVYRFFHFRQKVQYHDEWDVKLEQILKCHKDGVMKVFDNFSENSDVISAGDHLYSLMEYSWELRDACDMVLFLDSLLDSLTFRLEKKDFSDRDYLENINVLSTPLTHFHCVTKLLIDNEENDYMNYTEKVVNARLFWELKFDKSYSGANFVRYKLPPVKEREQLLELRELELKPVTEKEWN